MILAALLSAAIAQPDAAPAPAFETRTFEQAWQTFESICVTPLPSPQRFVDAMHATGLRWRKVDKTPAQIFGLGNSWRSTIGEITYRYRPELQHLLAGPACHLEFRTGEHYAHAEAADAVQRRIALPPGRDTGNRREPQTRWETRFAGGMAVRVFLTSNVAVAGGSGARLSISRRDTTPLRREDRAR
ncbi:MAG: hypothetical protein QOJ53_1135 [Sphingomonadales bacterium]|jgi:hypothetical protein|nr:hypothetical protein [Sphingomonadales bacterium]